MTDRYTEVTTHSYGERVKSSFAGIVVGLIFFACAFPLLLWNEGRAVKAFRGLEEGLAVVLPVAAAPVDRANEGRLVHFFGRAETDETLEDPVFGLRAGAVLRLRRTVELYQWEETEHTRTKTEAGGSERRETTYEYRRVWHEGRIDSARFRYPEGHANPEPSHRSADYTAGKVTVGGFRLPEDLVRDLDAFRPLPPAELGANLPAGFARTGDVLYKGTPDSPRVGDERVSFEVVGEMDVTVVAEQSAATVKPFRTSAGTDLSVIYPGRLSTEQVFDKEETKEAWLTWILRVIGFFLLYFGLLLLMQPLAVLVSVLPILQSLVGGAAAITAFVLALPLWLLTMAFGWIFHRPVVAAALIGTAVAVTVLTVILRRRNRDKPAAA